MFASAKNANAGNSAPPRYDDTVVVTNAAAASSGSANPLDKLRELCRYHEISNFMALKLRQLENYDIVVICDDSGSMETPCGLGPGVSLRDPFSPSMGMTRWDELKATVRTIAAIAMTLDDDGIDIYFLNRPGLRNVTVPSAEFDAVFAARPNGLTPITRCLRQVLIDKNGLITTYRDRENHKKLLVIIATDGQPTDDTGRVDTEALKHLLLYERDIERVLVTFVACTDDDDALAYLNKWDHSIPGLDVVDDYVSERREIRKAQGDAFSFSRGDWVCKLLLGGMDKEIDRLDEVKVSTLAPITQQYQQQRRTKSDKKKCVIQ